MAKIANKQAKRTARRKAGDVRGPGSKKAGSQNRHKSMSIKGYTPPAK